MICEIDHGVRGLPQLGEILGIKACDFGLRGSIYISPYAIVMIDCFVDCGLKKESKFEENSTFESFLSILIVACSAFQMLLGVKVW